MSRDAILASIRRGLKRGPLPADQRAMLDGRLATHPRHLIPQRSRVPRPEQVALFVRNVEKEFGSVTRVADAKEIPGAVAETGTLMLPSDPARPTTLNILADTEIVVLRASRIVGAYEEAWDRLRAERTDPVTGGFMPRNVMFVTGPSRSADIEQTLELGAHGPRRLHIVLLDDDPAALPAP